MKESWGAKRGKGLLGAQHKVLGGYPDLLNSNIYKSQGGAGFPLAGNGSVMDPQDPEFRVLHFPRGDSWDPHGSQSGPDDGSPR